MIYIWLPNRPVHEFIKLPNLGNTCFINSVIQSIFHTPLIARSIIEHGCERKECHICWLRDIMCKRTDERALRALVESHQSESQRIHFTLFYSHTDGASEDTGKRNTMEDPAEYLLYLFNKLQRAFSVTESTEWVDAFFYDIKYTLICHQEIL